MTDASLTLRPAIEADRAAIDRLAAMEDADTLAGDVLVAELDGYVIAAIALADGRVVADVSRAVADIVNLLRNRREQLLATRAHSFSFATQLSRGVRRVGLWRAPVTA